MVTAFANTTREDMRKVISYDNMCNLDNLKVAKEPLPLPYNLQYMWLDVVNIGNYLSITMWYNRFSYVIVVLCDYN